MNDSRPDLLDGRVPSGPIANKWDKCQNEMLLQSPAVRRKFKVLVVGAGLAGASAAAALAEQGYRVTVLTLLDSPRRSHSVAAQGGVNAAKNYANDGDSIQRMFRDTLRGGDFRAREASVYRLAQLSNSVINGLIAQGVPFARDYGGSLLNRSFGGVQVSRTFYARGQTGQQLLLGVHGTLLRQVDAGTVKLLTRHEMLDLVVEDQRAVGVITRDLVTGAIERQGADAVVIASGGYSSVYRLSTNALNSNASAIWRCHRRGALMANPSFIQFHPTCMPQLNPAQCKLTLMSESLRNDGRVWVPKQAADPRSAQLIPENERDYFLERRYPAYGNLVPRDVASRAARAQINSGSGVGINGQSVFLDFSDSLKRLGKAVLEDRYGNLFEMYREASGQDPLEAPMQISPAPHFSMGGLWVDYHLRTNLRGLFAVGESNFADHGANRLGANSLLQTMVDGTFILPRTLANELALIGTSPICSEHHSFIRTENECRADQQTLLANKGQYSARDFHIKLGELLLKHVGVARSAEGLKAGSQMLAELAANFSCDLLVNSSDGLNAELERAGRVRDFIELGQLMAVDALTRNESCGAHFREEHSDAQGNPQRDDEQFCHVAAWQWTGEASKPKLNIEPLVFEALPPNIRNYV